MWRTDTVIVTILRQFAVASQDRLWGPHIFPVLSAFNSPSAARLSGWEGCAFDVKLVYDCACCHRLSPHALTARSRSGIDQCPGGLRRNISKSTSPPFSLRVFHAGYSTNEATLL